MKWRQVDDWHWERACTRYTVSRSLSFEKAKEGHWVYLGWFRPPAKDAVAESIGPEARDSLKAAIADCGAHIRQHKPRQKAA